MQFDVMGNEQVLKRLYAKYAAYFRENELVADIGCGTGVFLELLRQNKITGMGVEISDDYVSCCLKKNLSVTKQDALVFLAHNPGRFNGIFCAHIIEHFDGLAALDFVVKAAAALQKGGTLILITPNPKDLGVITENFWLDVTHKRPYPAALLKKMCEDAGLGILEFGEDRDTIPKVKRSLKSIVKKMRFGEFINRGDTFIVAQKPL
jgi:predicted TPR repeat methyltransferase